MHVQANRYHDDWHTRSADDWALEPARITEANHWLGLSANSRTAAGEPINGVTMEIADQTLTITRNYALFSPWLTHQYRHSVNNDVFASYPPGTARLVGFSAAQQVSENGVWRYWKVNAQENEHLAFTTKGKTLYAIRLEKPSAPFTIEPTAGWTESDVKSVRLLGSDAAVDWSIGPDGLRVTPPGDLGRNQFAWSFEIGTTSQQHQPNAIVSDSDQAMKRTRGVDLDGNAK